MLGGLNYFEDKLNHLNAQGFMFAAVRVVLGRDWGRERVMGGTE